MAGLKIKIYIQYLVLLTTWFFPLFFNGVGLRQPIHNDDFVAGCISSLLNHKIAYREFNISGAEILSYREMVFRVFKALNRKERILLLSPKVFPIFDIVSKIVPGLSKSNIEIARRMGIDLIFDHALPKRALDFNPRKFVLTKSDVEIIE